MIELAAAAAGVGRGRFFILAILLLERGTAYHDRLGHHLASYNRAAGTLHGPRLGELRRSDGGHRRRIPWSDHDGHRLCRGVGTRVTGAIVHADDVCARTLDLLGGDGANDGVVPVDCGRDTAAQRGGDALVAGSGRPGRVAKITGHEKVLVGSGTGQRRDGRYQRGRGFGRRSIGDTGNVGDLDDVRGTREDGGCDGLG